MPKSKYSDELKQQVIKECIEIDNVALVARRHDIPDNTVYTWLRKAKKNGSVKSLPKETEKQLKEAKKRLEKVSRENPPVKEIIGRKRA